MSDKDELVEFPQHTMIDTDLAPEERPPVPAPPREPARAAVRRPDPSPPLPADDDEPEPAATMLIQSPFAEAAPAPSGPRARLVVSFGNDRGKEFELPETTVVVGRSLEAGIVLNDPTVSRKHFEVHYRGGRHVLKDLGSGNGTRVGGQKVSEIELGEGMQIEVGQTLLVYTCDEAKTRAIELPDLAATRGTGPEMPIAGPPAAVRVKTPPRIQVETERPAEPVEGRRSRPAAIAIAALVVVVAGVLVAQFVFGVRILPIGGTVQTAEQAGPDPAALKAEAADLFARGMKAFQSRNWEQAVSLFEQAMQKDRTVEGLESALARAKDEKRNASLMAAAKSSIEKGRPDDAVQVLSRVADTSVYYAEARAMLASAGDPAITREIERIRGMLADKKPDARASYLALLEAHPDDERVIALRDEFVKAGITLDLPRKPPATGSTAPRVDTPRSDAPRAQKPGTGKLDPTRAMQLYNAGSFEQASAELRTMAERLRPEDAERARDLAGRIDRFAAAYGEGRAALAAKRLDKAEQGLSMALRLDHEVNGHFDEDIRALLGDTYRGRAAAALQNADYVQAAKSAKRALSYKAEDPLAKQILDKCIAMAQTQYNQAVADVQAGRKDAARGKLRTVLDIVPTSHPLADKAAELMQQVR